MSPRKPRLPPVSVVKPTTPVRVPVKPVKPPPPINAVPTAPIVVGPTVPVTAPPISVVVPPVSVLQPVSQIPGLVTGAPAVVSSLLLNNALQNAKIDEATRALITKSLAGILPGQVLAPGGTAAPRAVGPSDLQQLIPGAVVSAAGLDPTATSSPPPALLWEDAGNRLLVQLAGVKAAIGDGFIELAIPVSCDQAPSAEVTVTFVTGTPTNPSGGVTTTEDHPRGPAVIVETWHEPLIAFAWQVVLIATAALSGAVGTDASGRALITSDLAISKESLSVLPMAQHAFLQVNALP